MFYTLILKLLLLHNGCKEIIGLELVWLNLSESISDIWNKGKKTFTAVNYTPFLNLRT